MREPSLQEVRNWRGASVEEFFEVPESYCHFMRRRRDEGSVYQTTTWGAYPILSSAEFTGRPFGAAHSH
jgi:hypothetical protein